jgi:uncharacterized membrane protein
MRKRMQWIGAGYIRGMGAPGDRNAEALQDDRGLRRAKLVAGVVSVLVLVGLFVTSLFRAPEPAWTVVLAVTACGLAVAIVLGVRSRRRR